MILLCRFPLRLLCLWSSFDPSHRANPAIVRQKARITKIRHSGLERLGEYPLADHSDLENRFIGIRVDDCKAFAVHRRI